jgi:hypothetical protein
MKKYLIISSVLCFVLFSLAGCIKRNDMPITPVITFKDFAIMGDSARLVIKFTDGDGDLGLSDDEISPPYDYNVFIKYMEKVNGTYRERVLSFPFNFRIPRISTSDRKKPAQGEVHISITPTYYDPFSTHDTIRYELYIKDRALHESNSIQTNDIIIER